MDHVLDLPQRPADDGPAPMAWADYVRSVLADYQALLSASPLEAEMQRFFEHNPALVPGAFPSAMGHGAFPDALISQPALSGIGDRRPDFMWIARNSAVVQPVLIEIESPGKRWLAGKGRDARPSADLTQALNQLRQWEQWLEKPANQEVLLETYGVPADWRRTRALRPQYWLIYGRREENPAEIGKLRDYYGQRGLNVHAYDNLRRPNEWCRDYLTVRSRSGGIYTAMCVPPTATWVAGSPQSWRAVKDRENAVRAAPQLSDDRKRYLIEQLPAWDAWAAYWLDRRTSSE